MKRYSKNTFTLLFLYALLPLPLSLNVLAEKESKNFYETEIKWKKIKSKFSFEEEIIWKPYNSKEAKEKSNLKFENYEFEKNNLRFIKKKNDKLTQIEPYLPTNTFLEYRDLQVNINWKSSFSGGKSGGIGQQNNSLRIDYGILEDLLFTIYFAEADDDLYNNINGLRAQYSWQNYAFSIKKNLYSDEKPKLSLSLVSTLEYWRSSSGSELSKSIYNEIDESYGKDKFINLIASFSLPFSKEIKNDFTFIFTPGITFIPEKIGNRTNRNNYYGNNFYLGTGFIFDLSEDLSFLASYTNLFGPGNNYFDSKLNFGRKSIYSFGLNWDINSRIGIEGKLTNSYGSTPSTGLLTIPSDDLLTYSANITYSPYKKDTPLKPNNKRDKLITHGGIIVSNALIPKSGSSQISLNNDYNGNLFLSYSYSLSNIFQLEVLNIGAFRNLNFTSSSNLGLKTNYLDDNNLNYRFGGKLLLLSPQKDDLFWMSLRTSVGRNDNTNQGYLYSELLNTFRISDSVAFNFSPKYFMSGVKNFGVLGASLYVNLFDNLQIIPELNKSFDNSNDLTTSIAFRYNYGIGKSMDLYYSNAVGIQDIGQILKDKDYKIGIKLNFLY